MMELQGISDAWLELKTKITAMLLFNIHVSCISKETSEFKRIGLENGFCFSIWKNVVA